MQVFILLLRYHAVILFIMQTLETYIPDGDAAAPTGLQKLDIALKRLIGFDASLANKVPELTKAIGLVKSTMNDVKALTAKAPAAA